MPQLGITEVVLVHCNILNNDYQQDSRTLNTFVSNKSFGQLLDYFVQINQFWLLIIELTFLMKLMLLLNRLK